MILSNNTKIELSGLQVDTIEEVKRIEAETPEKPEIDDVNVSANAGSVGDSNNVVSLNGAQVASATEIVKAVGTGEITRSAAINMLSILFNLTPSQAGDMIEGMDPNKQASSLPSGEEDDITAPRSDGEAQE